MARRRETSSPAAEAAGGALCEANGSANAGPLHVCFLNSVRALRVVPAQTTPTHSRSASSAINRDWHAHPEPTRIFQKFPKPPFRNPETRKCSGEIADRVFCAVPWVACSPALSEMRRSQPTRQGSRAAVPARSHTKRAPPARPRCQAAGAAQPAPEPVLLAGAPTPPVCRLLLPFASSSSPLPLKSSSPAAALT